MPSESASFFTVQVLYFASVRERLGRDQEAVDLPEGATAGVLLDALSRRHAFLSAYQSSLRVAVNEAFVPLGHPLSPGDEVALIPPVSGGAPYCRLRREALSLDEVVAAVGGPGHPSQGGVVTFLGVVRDHSRGKSVTRLEYEAYEAMALRTMAALISGIEAEHPGARVAIVHRLGSLAPGEAAVAIAASAAHRAEAFSACRAAIDRLKQDVPIWKKELTTDGQEWVGDRP